MNYKKNSVEHPVGQLMLGYPRRYGLLKHPQSGHHFFGCGHDYEVDNLYISHNGQFFDSSFDGHIIFQTPAKEKKPSFILYTEDFRYVVSSDDPCDFCCIAIMKPRFRPMTDGEYDPEFDKIPICLKLSFSPFGQCAALVQNSDVCNLWMAEGEMMRKSAHPDVQEMPTLEGGTLNE